jgi:hypothetical protein
VDDLRGDRWHEFTGFLAGLRTRKLHRCHIAQSDSDAGYCHNDSYRGVAGGLFGDRHVVVHDQQYKGGEWHAPCNLPPEGNHVWLVQSVSTGSLSAGLKEAMTLRKLAKTLVMGTMLLVGMSGGAEALDQIIGLSTNDQGSALVKRFLVPAGTIVTGIEVKSNDDGTVFPRIALFRGPAPRLSDAVLLVEVDNVPSAERHRVRTSVGTIVAGRGEEIFVAVSWPVSTGVRGVGDGAGIGATALTIPGDCFISPGHGELLQPLLADLAISLITGVGKAEGTGPEPAEVVHRTYLAKSAISSATGQARIEFGLARSGMASLEIYSVSGRLVRVLTSSEHTAGRHVLGWDGNDEGGHRVAAGVYLTKLVTSAEVLTERVVVVR